MKIARQHRPLKSPEGGRFLPFGEARWDPKFDLLSSILAFNIKKSNTAILK